MWHYRESGTGPPLVLLHGIGMSHATWRAVVPFLSPTRRVIAFDVAGFGETPALASGVAPTIEHLTESLARTLDDLCLREPVDIAGNSLGGAIALTLAKLGRARSVVAISPACLWRQSPPFHVRHVFAALVSGSKRCPAVLKLAMRAGVLRELMLALPMSVGSRRMPASEAANAIDDLRRSTAFFETFDATRGPFMGGTAINVPVTVAFGTCDWLLPRWSQVRDQLPVHTRWLEPKGWGHVPLWADPRGVAALILGGIPPAALADGDMAASPQPGRRAVAAAAPDSPISAEPEADRRWDRAVRTRAAADPCCSPCTRTRSVPVPAASA
jgi:pimeloyl-ACP methyl ester carboxylesterase